MCGFLVDFNAPSVLLKQDFISLLSKSNHRGPNDQGYWNNESNIQMGFNRLSILELTEAGHQPMDSFNKRYTLVFNGEIYNHLELRKQLDFQKFRGSSDTETITACLEEWGINKTIRSLDGMFALVVYDHLTSELHLVRDFAGIKPLFYGKKGRQVVAASQYDQVHLHPSFVNEDVNPEVLKLYLQQHFVPAPFGLYENTYQVFPGEHIIFFPDGSSKNEMYWEFPGLGSDLITNEKEAMQLIEETLTSCVQNQLLSDVQVGAFLSGGVDSPLICAKALSFYPGLRMFSIGSDSKIHDESSRATSFAKAMNSSHSLWKLTANEVLPFWNEVMLSLHEPMADFSIVPTFLVSKLARKEVTVALSGDGGDELFFGYERFWSVGKNANYQQWPPLFKKALYGTNKYLLKTKKINSNLLASSQANSHENLHSRFNKHLLQQIAPDLKSTSLPPEWKVYSYPNTKDERELLHAMQKAEFYGMMQKTLRKVDLASMQNSLEVRVPFLQKKMIETSLRIDPFLNGGQGKQKQLLKKILSQHFPSIPEETQKKGFSIPLTQWIREDLKSEFCQTLLENDLSNWGFEKKAVELLLQDHLKGKLDAKWPLFTLYSLVKC